MSMSSDGSVICRICHCGDTNEEPLLAPCHCTGTMAMIHRTCVERWLSTRTRGRQKCEICGFKYTTTMKLRKCGEWLITAKNDRHNLIGDVICFVLLTPLAVLAGWMCMNGAMLYYNYLQGENWETLGLLILTACLIVVYCIWLGMAVHYHIRRFYNWRNRNPIVEIDLGPPITAADENNNPSLNDLRTEPCALVRTLSAPECDHPPLAASSPVHAWVHSSGSERFDTLDPDHTIKSPAGSVSSGIETYV